MSHPHTNSELTQLVRDEAERLGFSGVGVTSARPHPDPGRFDLWLTMGMHGTMGYLARQQARRLDPRMLLPEARSLLALAFTYGVEELPSDDPVTALTGRISRYAVVDDYHPAVSRRLDALLSFIQREAPGTRGRGFVDSGPVMEKVWGAQTSLGWTGKHSILVSKSIGSWFFIGVLLLDRELEYDRPHDDGCGICRRCIDACPTGAIIEPYVVDARRCISYLTIELRDEIPTPLRPLVGNRIFGCDACQEVCPWNRAPLASRALRGRSADLSPDLTSLVAIAPEEFERRFEGRPLLRAGRDGLVRNVAVALGNSGRPEAATALHAALKDPSPMVRAHAAWALERLCKFR